MHVKKSATIFSLMTVCLFVGSTLAQTAQPAASALTPEERVRSEVVSDHPRQLFEIDCGIVREAVEVQAGVGSQVRGRSG